MSCLRVRVGLRRSLRGTSPKDRSESVALSNVFAFLLRRPRADLRP